MFVVLMDKYCISEKLIVIWVLKLCLYTITTKAIINNGIQDCFSCLHVSNTQRVLLTISLKVPVFTQYSRWWLKIFSYPNFLDWCPDYGKRPDQKNIIENWRFSQRIPLFWQKGKIYKKSKTIGKDKWQVLFDFEITRRKIFNAL